MHIPHKQDGDSERCRAGGRAAAFARPRALFARVVGNAMQRDARNHNLKPLERRDELTARLSSGRIVHTLLKIISTVLTGRGPLASDASAAAVSSCLRK